MGCGHPITINNTYALEKEYSWTGVSVDIGPNELNSYDLIGRLNVPNTISEYEEFWNKNRNTPIICKSALEIDYSKFFKEYNLPKNIDYLSIDLDPQETTLECLFKIPFSEYTFNIITFETDFYNKIVDTRTPAREFLSDFGYLPVNNEKVMIPFLPPARIMGPSEWGGKWNFETCFMLDQEDWYIHESIIDKTDFEFKDMIITGFKEKSQWWEDNQ